jgi:hypothetical protein
MSNKFNKTGLVDWVRKNYERFNSSEEMIDAASKIFKVPRHSVIDAKYQARIGKMRKFKSVKNLLKVEAVIDSLDYVLKVKNNILSLGEDNVIEDVSFRNEMKIPATKWKMLRNMKEFAPYQLKLPRMFIWGSKNALKKIKEKLVIL